MHPSLKFEGLDILEGQHRTAVKGELEVMKTRARYGHVPKSKKRVLGTIPIINK